MNLKEFYECIEGDYESVTARLMGEKLTERFVLKFLDDPSYDLLCASLDAGNNEEAFRAAHTIKGVSQNLSFTKLYESSSALSDELRGGGEANAETVKRVKADYLKTADAVKRLKADNA